MNSPKIDAALNRKLVLQAQRKNLLNFNYRDKEGNIKPHSVEVYDIKDDGKYFYGTNPFETRPKQFAFDRMFDVSIGDSFIPRF